MLPVLCESPCFTLDLLWKDTAAVTSRVYSNPSTRFYVLGSTFRRYISFINLVTAIEQQQ